MLTTPTHHNRRLRAGALLAAFGLGLPVGMAPALAETLTAQAQVDAEAAANTDAAAPDTDDEAGITGAAQVDADLSVDGDLNGLLDRSGDNPNGNGGADAAVLTDLAASAAAPGALALDVAGRWSGGAGGGVILPALSGLTLDGDLYYSGNVGPGDGAGGGELSAQVLVLLGSDAGPDTGSPGVGVPGTEVPNLGLPGGLPGLGLPGPGLPGPGLPGPGLPGPGLPGGLPALGLPGLGLPGAGLPGLGLPGLGVPSVGVPGLGFPSRPDRLPSVVLPSVIDAAPSRQDDDPAVVNAGHVGPVGGFVNTTGGKPGDGPAGGAGAAPTDQPYTGPSQSGGDPSGSLPRTGANLRLRVLAAFGLLGLAGLGGRRRRSA